MARNPLSLQAYLTMVRGASGEPAPALPARPAGPVVMLCAEDRANGSALAGLGARLRAHRAEFRIVTVGAVPPDGADAAVSWPPERIADCTDFAEALRPDAVIWAGRTLRPALLDALKRTGARLIAINAPAEPWQVPTPRWLPDPTAATLALFDRIHATDADALRQLRRLGIETGRVRQSGALLDASLPLDCSDRLHEEMAALLAGRPVWLSAHLHGDEADIVLRAHRQAVRLAHRLLLIAVPAGPEHAAPVRAACEGLDMRACLWEDGGMPDENTQVLLTEGPEDLGLWYRLAPLAFLGGSMVAGHGGRNPFEAAALGAAVLYGPNVGQHLESYSRLVAAGAARIVRDADSLATAVSHLIAPDKAAAMAHAGWDVVSQGAELVDALIADIGTHLDAKRRR